jgi:hypothetical protein
MIATFHASMHSCNIIFPPPHHSIITGWNKQKRGKGIPYYFVLGCECAKMTYDKKEI